MARIQYRDEESRSGTLVAVVVGALAGFAVGVLAVQRMGGISGVKNRLRRRDGSDLEAGSYAGHGAEVGDYHDADDEIIDDDRDTDLEDRVLEAFRNDPTMSERGIDIGSAGPGVIELTGWVDTDAEADYAVTLARGVPGVDTVLNRLGIGDDLALDAGRTAERDPLWRRRTAIRRTRSSRPVPRRSTSSRTRRCGIPRPPSRSTGLARSAPKSRCPRRSIRSATRVLAARSTSSTAMPPPRRTAAWSRRHSVSTPTRVSVTEK